MTGRDDHRSVRASLAPAHAGLDLPPLVVDGTHSAVLVRLDPVRAILTGPDDGGWREPVLLFPPPPGSLVARDARATQRWEVVVDGWRVEVDVESERQAALRERARRGTGDPAGLGPTEVRAIIPGVVLSVLVAAGDAVTAGQHLLVIEAMKMENELRAPRDGTIERVAVGAGQTIDVGELLVVIG